MKRSSSLARELLCLIGLFTTSALALATPSADEAFQALQAGNARYVAGKPAHPNQTAERRSAVAAGQAPFVTVLSCADSRVPVEVLFDQGIGDTFVIRVAGNVADTDEIGTIEYGVGHLNTPLLVVLGHSSCGAVKAVCEGAQVHGSIPKLVDNIIPAVAKAKASGATGAALISAAVTANVWQAVDDVFKNSAEVRELVQAGKLTVVGAVYDLESGTVNFLGAHPQQAQLLTYTGGAGHGADAAHGGENHGGDNSHAVTGHTDHSATGSGPAAASHAAPESAHVAASSHAASAAPHEASTSQAAILTSIGAVILFSLVAGGVFWTTRQRTIRVRILANSAVLLVMLLGLGGFVYAEFNKIGQELDATAEDDLPILITLADAETKVVKQALYLEKFGATKDAALASEFERFSKEVAEELLEAETELKQAVEHTTHPEQRQGYEKLLTEVAALEKEHRDFDQEGDALLTAIKTGQRTHLAELMKKIATEEAEMISAFTNVSSGIKAETLHAAQLSTSLEHSGKVMVVAVSLCSLIIGLLFALVISRSINKQLGSVVNSLASGAAQTASAASQVSAASQTLAEGASEQAASLEETSASLEEISSMIKRNATNAASAKILANETRQAADTGVTNMTEMSQAMNGIKTSSDNVAKIIKTIDEIAFQTNLLALNAAVEAARAGEAGAGFAVVADEVRSLAQRSAVAAKETAAKIEDAIHQSEQGVVISEKVATSLQEIVSKVRQVDDLVAEIATASSEQSQGIGQITVATNQMDSVTQSNAASAEESASASEEMNAQACTLQGIVGELEQLVTGTKHGAKAGDIPMPVETRASQPAAVSRRKAAAPKTPGKASPSKPALAPDRDEAHAAFGQSLQSPARKAPVTVAGEQAFQNF